MKIIVFTLIVFSLFASLPGKAQVYDSSAVTKKFRSTVTDSLPDIPRLKHPLRDTTQKDNRPRNAAIRSAILPGLGQIYNKAYWKLPIVYGALGVTGYIFFDNLKTYREYRFAYTARYKASLPMPDSTDYFTLKEIYKRIQPESIRAARNQFRQYIDYSAVFFIIFWGLNVIDATVDAHLKSFDVSPDLSLQIKPGHSEMANTNGISLVLNIGRNYSK
jgi:hypothetical protein